VRSPEDPRLRPDVLRTALSVGFETLRANPLRTILSTLGIIIGVGSLVAVLSVGDGMEQSMRDQISTTTDLHAINVRPRLTEEIDGQFFPVPDPVLLRPDDARALRTVDGVASVMYRRLGQVEVRSPFRPVRRMASLDVDLTLPDSAPAPHIATGRMLTPDELGGTATIAVITHDLARSITADSTAPSAVGEIILLRDTPVEVVGVLDPSVPSPFPARRGAGDYRVISTSGVLESTLRDVAQNPAAIVAVSGVVEQTGAVRGRIEQWVAARDSSWGRKVMVSTNERRLEQLSTAILMFKLFLGAITGISLLVGGIGIMNVLLSSVTERTREIGIRKATGAQDRDIHLQFLAESVAISGVGSAIGLVIGIAGAFGITAGIRRFSNAPFLSASLSWSTVLVAVLAAVIVGLVFGTYPARRAARLSPIDAIRHE
jgi:putative ABC transport system permease protein